ncbi:MAG: B12-binding domain-containing radical SAM protein [Sandaracinaceae bacterium]|nr:B12-binding domain-containing radical SAM protein [Sandaracinaceae bacterium]
MRAHTGRVRCLLVRPPFSDATFYNPREMFRLLGGESAAPPLGLLIAAAYLPESWELRFIDGDLDPIEDADLAWADVLFITGKGPQILPIRALVGRARALGVTTVVGGAGPTLQPDDFRGVGDYVVRGECEPVIEELLADLAAGVSKGVYHRPEGTDLAKYARLPRYDLAELDRYMFVGMSYTRGCPFTCEFCAQIEIFGKPRTRSVEHVLAEHQLLYDLGYRGMIDLGYDNLIGDIGHTTRVLEALAAWNREHHHPFFYSTEATMNLARQPRLLELMRDNDFRYVFMGIESGDEEALAKTKKGQNIAMDPERAVSVLNSYGIVVNTGLILGFDGERPDAADRMLDMVQRTAAFPTLVLPLHALPNTGLSRRLAREGRLFAAFEMTEEERTDTATTGLNFVTARPRVEVLRDLARVLDTLYRPETHYARVARITERLETRYAFVPPPKKLAQLSLAFARIATQMTRDRETAPYFWRALGRALVTNPGALTAVIGQAVMNANYREQARSYVAALERQIAEIEAVGEDRFNREMLAGAAA